jgi:translocation and assembly module TamB
MKLLGRLFALCFTLLTMILVFTVYLLHSPNGLEWGYRFAAILLPGELTIEHLEGRLRGPLTLQGVHYRNDKMDLQMAQLAMQWQPGALVGGTLKINSLTISGLHIVNEPASTKTIALPDVHLPISVKIDQATVHDLRVAEQGESTPFTLLDASLSNAEFKHHQLHLQHLSLTAPHYQLTATGDLTPQQDYPLDLDVQWSVDGGEYGKIAGRTKLSGDLRQLKLHHQFISPVHAELSGTVTDALTNLSWQAELKVPEIGLQTLREQWPSLTLSGTVHGSGTLHSIHSEGDIHSNYQSLTADHRFDLDYADDILKINRLETTLARSGTRLTLHGSLDHLTQQAQATLEGSWQGLRWPLQGESRIHSDAGHFRLAGTLDHYQIHVDGDLAGAQVPTGTWSVDGEGTPRDLTITTATGRFLGGNSTANGKLVWQPQLHWEAAMQSSDLNPGEKWPEWPGHLAVSARASGAITDGIMQISVALTQLQGELKSMPIDGDGALTMRGEQLHLAKLRLDSGGNHFTAQGSLHDTWNMQWQVTTTDVDKSKIFSPTPPLPTGEGQSEDGRFPRFAGRLQGSGAISGPRDDPLFTASLSGRQLNIADNHIGEINLVMAVDVQDRVPAVLELEAHDATHGNLRLDSIRLHGEGTGQGHQLQLFATASNSTLALELNGQYRHQQWTGTVDGLDIVAPVAGHWQLAAPTRITLDLSAAHLDELCLHQVDARICTQAKWSAQSGWETRGLLRNVPLSLIKDWLPSGVSLAGGLDGDIQAGADASGRINGKAAVQLKLGLIPPGPPGRDDLSASIIYHQAHATITLDEQNLTFQLTTELPDGGGMQGAITIGRKALPAPLGNGQSDLDTALSGQLKGDIKELSLLPVLIPGVEHTQGHLLITLTIAGSLDKPRVIGELRLENGSAAIPALGINLEAISLVARGDEQGHLRFDSHLNSKGGTLRLGGELHYDKVHGLNLQAQFNGDKAEIVNTPEYRVLASPNMHISLQDHRIDLDGELFIPEANLRPRDVSGAVSASDDVIIVNAESPPASATRWQIYSQVRLRLGEFVKFNGFGLQGLLKGDITLVDEPQHPTIARGELSITNGEYHAYGQNLQIDRGRLLFIGGPVDNPGLDIRAVRQIQEVTAGILVRGTIKSPQVQLFSDPAMAETDALSYLLTGQPISQASSTQGQQLYGAALSLGLAGSGLLADQIGRRFGIDELTVESGGSFGGGALVIRHYLSPKLYISYGVGLMEQFNAFLIRYQLSRRWSLEADSGVTTGADIVYTLERK